jgi:hypothetical protein
VHSRSVLLSARYFLSSCYVAMASRRESSMRGRSMLLSARHFLSSCCVAIVSRCEPTVYGHDVSPLTHYLVFLLHGRGTSPSCSLIAWPWHLAVSPLCIVAASRHKPAVLFSYYVAMAFRREPAVHDRGVSPSIHYLVFSLCGHDISP